MDSTGAVLAKESSPLGEDYVGNIQGPSVSCQPRKTGHVCYLLHWGHFSIQLRKKGKLLPSWGRFFEWTSYSSLQHETKILQPCTGMSPHPLCLTELSNSSMAKNGQKSTKWLGMFFRLGCQLTFRKAWFLFFQSQEIAVGQCLAGTLKITSHLRRNTGLTSI